MPPCEVPGEMPAVASAADVDITWDVRIPLRDDVHLSAILYRPRAQADPLPAVFTLTPYVADTWHDRGMYFAAHGYVFASVDVRGRGNSEGDFEPFLNEGPDGHDAVQWLAAQPWCDGQVAMWGGSYAGFDQWATLKQGPAALATIAPVASVGTGVDYPALNNITYSYVMQWLTFVSGRTPNNSLFRDQAHWVEQFRRVYLEERPFCELDEAVGNPSPHFQEWIRHPATPTYWQRLLPTEREFVSFDRPILTITGHYDDDQPGALHYYREHMRHGSAAATRRHYLVIGPWDHPGTRTPQRQVGGLTFGEASLVDVNGLHRDWYDWTMKAGPQPEFLRDRVAVYLPGPGAEVWGYAPSLEQVTAGTRALQLRPAPAGAADALAAGALVERPEGSGAGADTPPTAPAYDEYEYNPRDLRPAQLETEPFENWITDQRYALNLFGNGAVYHSAPLEEDTDIAGQFRLVLWMELDVPDTDFLATVYELAPDGSSVLLSQDVLRARYRHSLEEEELVTPGAVEQYELAGFPFMARRLGRGSRLRLVVRCPNSIYWQKNRNSGGDVSRETAAQARVAHVKIHADAEHDSHLDVPLAAPLWAGSEDG